MLVGIKFYYFLEADGAEGRKQLLLIKKKLDYYSSWVLTHADDNIPLLTAEVLAEKGKRVRVTGFSHFSISIIQLTVLLHCLLKFVFAFCLNANLRSYLSISEKILSEMAQHQKVDELKKLKKSAQASKPKIEEL